MAGKQSTSKVVAAGIVAAALATGTSACSSSSSNQQDSADHELVIGATLAPQSMDPTTAAGAAIPQALLYNVYETLVKVDGQGEIKPLLAQKWTTSPDRLTYTFMLQPKAKFSDGKPVDAAAVVANINRVKSGTTSGGAPITSLLHDKMAVVTSATATDEHTVTVKLSRPSQAWLYDMTTAAGIIAEPSSFATLGSHPVASGPFAFADFKANQSVTLDRNTQYWGTPATFDKVSFRYFSDANAMTSAMKSGDLDVISDLTTPEAVSSFSDSSTYTVTEGTSNGEVTLGMNQSASGNPALRNVKVRQAINHAINRQALLDAVWGGKGTLIGSMVPPTDPWYQDLSKTYPYDPAKAKALLAEAGVKNLTLKLRVPTTPYGPPAAQFIASQLKQVGITVTVEQLDFPRWIKEVYTDKNYDMTIVNHVEPRDILTFASPKNYWGYANPAFNKLIATADAADDATYTADMQKAAKLLASDAAADWLWLFPHIVVTKADITGVSQNQTSASFDVTTIASRNG